MSDITKKDLEDLRHQLFEDLSLLLSSISQSKEESETQPKSQKKEQAEWLRSKDVKKMLSISDAGLQNLRIRGLVHPVKISGLYYYKSEEVKSLFKS